MSFSLRCELIYLHAATPAAATGYAPMDVIWFLSLLLCVLGSSKALASVAVMLIC